MREQQSHFIVQSNNSIIVTPGRGERKNASLARSLGELNMMISTASLFRLSPIALWGSAARGVTAAELLADIEIASDDGVPATFAAQVADVMGRYGALRLEERGGEHWLVGRDPGLLGRLDLGVDDAPAGCIVQPKDIGRLKIAAARAGWPIVDASRRNLAGSLDIELRDGVALRPYQRDAVESVWRAGSGVVLLPCGAGKTVVGVATTCQAKCPTLILTPSRSVAEQWRTTLTDLTTVDPANLSVSESGGAVTPVTIATYHAATMGNASGQLLDHLWGLVIYDEVQSLPADVFRLAAAFQSARRLGLTATLVREDGKQQEVFALVGPAVYQLPWTELERMGWIAPARCAEVRIPRTSKPAELNRYKLAVVQRLLALHEGKPTLIVGTKLDILEQASKRFNIPMLSGKSGSRHRDETFDAFRQGTIDRLILSRVGSLGIDLPSAEVLIQLNGMFGSRQEEAQRLGRVLRPGPGKVARFYTVVADAGPERRYAAKRQLYLVEQGYSYDLIHASDLPGPARN